MRTSLLAVSTNMYVPGDDSERIALVRSSTGDPGREREDMLTHVHRTVTEALSPSGSTTLPLSTAEAPSEYVAEVGDTLTISGVGRTRNLTCAEVLEQSDGPGKQI